jgi:hypothetical protein
VTKRFSKWGGSIPRKKKKNFGKKKKKNFLENFKNKKKNILEFLKKFWGSEKISFKILKKVKKN